MKKYTILLAILFIISCGPEPADPVAELIIKNHSTYPLELTIYNAGIANQSPHDITFSLPINNETVYFYWSDIELLISPADSTFITFNNEKRIIYRKNDGQPRNILDINSWEYKQGVSVENIYIYTITDEDYENALAIK
ncbi:MAG: hypothetical protein RBT49_04930 [Bacteroidales bacterium]|nr:hypothetical protein [Bacteroidales bacterium]